MKTFVLAAVALSPAALSAQVLFSSPVPAPVPAHLPWPIERDRPVAPPAALFAAEIAPDRPRTDYKLRVVRPPADANARMLVGRPDDRYNYKILTPQPNAPARRRLPAAPKR